MRIGILGTGAMATALGGAWVRAGHAVMVGGRNPASAAATAARIGATAHGTLAEAAGFGEAVLFALPADVAPRVAKELSSELAGRAVLDCTVPMRPSADGPMLTTTGDTDSNATRIATAAPESHVVKVFGVCHESIWTLPRPTFEGAPLAVPYCTDNTDQAAALTGELITSMGCDPLPCGGLGRAALLEAAAVFAIGVWWAGREARQVYPSPALAPGAVDD
ncbi:NAD(P)-binding domain-containing protein [Streptomyces sp. OF3]|uniref:NAD(P)-binding domain-containing protein n=2 Tax=Streptomyces alkaliterrae TaxID=2213162 RepID=A0A7W3WL41_9ACTN|nr:NAD(P)-binding domain-containing protein [Streptomyces alkaliterrae]